MARKHRAKGFTAPASPAPMFHPGISSPSCSSSPHSPSGLAGKSSQAQHRVRAATSWVPHHTISFLLTRWAPLDTEHLDKAVSCQGCPKSGQPAQESAAFSALPWICMWEILGEQGSLPWLFFSNPLQALLLTEISRVQRVKQGNSMFFSGKEPNYLHLQTSSHGKQPTSQEQSGRRALGPNSFMVFQHLQVPP